MSRPVQLLTEPWHLAHRFVVSIPGHPPSAFLAAKLTYRFLAEIFANS